MHHVAIMNPRWHLIDKVLRREKTVESRWYRTRRAPWGAISVGDVVWFKDAGKLVSARATVARVEQHELTPSGVISLLERHGGAIGVGAIEHAYERYCDKRYCILIWLQDPRPVEPFAIDKRGFGNANAWLTIDHIKKITC
jgi:hypothetical protein